MGAESYGLVGFFTMLQAWFLLLDLGLTPTAARETARFRGGATDALSYRRLVRALEGIFLLMALIGGTLLFAVADFIATDWLKTSRLPSDEVKYSLQLMAVIVAMRWICGLYRGIVNGSERLAWLGGYNALIATLRFVGALPILIWLGATPVVFFSYQLAVAVIEMTWLILFAHRLLPPIPEGQPLAFAWSPLRPVLKFSLSIAFTSSVWIMVTQTDKLLLSKLLSLSEYGYFTLAVLVSGVVMIVSGPISSAILPRLSKLEAEQDHANLLRLYRQSTRLVAAIVFPLSFVLAAFAQPLLWTWSGDRHLAVSAAPILSLYALGNGVMVLSAFAYYLQYAKGDLRLHLRGSAFFLVILIPTLIWATMNFGAIGAGWAWLLSNSLYFIFWVALVHHRLEPGLHRRWLQTDLSRYALIAAGLAWTCLTAIPLPETRWGTALVLFAIWSLVTLATAYASPDIRSRMSQIANTSYQKLRRNTPA